MRLNPCLPLMFGTKVTSRIAGRLEMTVAVRAAFRLAPGQPLTPIESPEEVVLEGDVFADGDDDRTGALVQASDLADFKMKTDILVRGTCYPGERAAKVCAPRVAVGNWSKTLRVFGRRVWTENPAAPISDPVPFDSMPITYQNAFGGPEFALNPSGKGYRTAELPTVENPASLITSRGDRPDPAGFGPISPFWPQRAKKIGTQYDKAWKKERAPFYAADFDWSYFNAAPIDQQRPGYLKGDEAVVFEYLHPKSTRLAATLPGIRPRVFVRRTDGFTAEVAMSLDTLLVDLDKDKLALVWRGLVEVKDDQRDDVRTLFIGSESLSKPRPKEEYLAELEALDKDPVAYLKDKLIPEHLKKKLADAKATGEKAKADVAAILANAKAAPSNAALKVPSPPSIVLPPTPAPEAGAAHIGAALEKAGGGPADGRTALGKLQGMLEGASAKAQVTEQQAAASPPPTMGDMQAKATQAIAKAKAGAASKGGPVAHFEAAEQQLAAGIEQKRAFDAKSAAPGLVPAEMPELPGTPASPFATEPGPGANLMERDLSGRDLRGLDLRRALMGKAKLTGAKLAGANLAGADLGGVDLEGADLTGADLSRTNLMGARARGATFDKATLASTIFAKADLTEASLVGVQGKMTVFQGAVLTSARLGQSRFHKAIFAKARIDGADFSGADLDRCMFLEASGERARFDGARMNKVVFLKSQLTEASFSEATGERCSWQGSTLDRADFRHAVLRRCHLNKASLVRAKLYASDFRGGRFERASLAEADFRQADLMAVSFCKARLSATDFSGSSLYNAKFLGASMQTKCNFDGANLNSAIWEQR